MGIQYLPVGGAVLSTKARERMYNIRRDRRDVRGVSLRTRIRCYRGGVCERGYRS